MRGKAAAQGFYEYLTKNIQTETMIPSSATTARTPASSSTPGPGRCRASSSEYLATVADHVPHGPVWEFRDGLISRENVWLDGGSIIAQLTTPDLAASTA